MEFGGYWKPFIQDVISFFIPCLSHSVWGKARWLSQYSYNYRNINYMTNIEQLLWNLYTCMLTRWKIISAEQKLCSLYNQYIDFYICFNAEKTTNKKNFSIEFSFIKEKTTSALIVVLK